MKQCISRIRKFLIHLWQTLKEYVCKRNIRMEDVDNDNKLEIVIETEIPSEFQEENQSEKEV